MNRMVMCATNPAKGGAGNKKLQLVSKLISDHYQKLETLNDSRIQVFPLGAGG